MAEEQTMNVSKRDGTLEPVNVNKIINSITRNCKGLNSIVPMVIASKTIGGLYDGVSTQELDQISIQTTASMIANDPEYSKLASRLLLNLLTKEVTNQNIYSFSQSIQIGEENGLISEETAKFVKKHSRKLNDAIRDERSDLFEYFGLTTVYDRYLLKHPNTRKIIETPQYFLMRVACGLSKNVNEALEFYNLISNLDYLPGSPTLFNSGTRHSQMSSCYLLDSPLDSLESIYDKYKDVALLSKYAGGIGIAYSRIRSKDSIIKGTNGQSNGIVPWLKTLDSSVLSVNQGGRRRGAACVYLETWHADIEDFLELKDNTGDLNRRAYNLNLANWVPDLFMQRVENDENWSLFDPSDTPDLVDLYGEKFENRYFEYESQGKAKKVLKARDLYAKMMKCLSETGNGWMCFKDSCNKKSNQTKLPQNVIHLSNLCSEISEVTSTINNETAVCNLGSINLANHMYYGADGNKFHEPNAELPDYFFDYEKLTATVKTAVKFLDRVVDINFYPINSAKNSNKKWRPIGLGIMGLQDVFFLKNIAFDSEEALILSTKIQSEIYYNALNTSADLAIELGSFPNLDQTYYKDGILQFELWGNGCKEGTKWVELKEKIKTTGIRNSLLIAIAPTATIGTISGAYECIEPQTSNLFKRETLSGEFIQINKYLVNRLKTLGLWNEEMKEKIKGNNGSVQNIEEIPDEVKSVFKTTWEVAAKTLIDLAAARAPFIDQSQSLNLFIQSPNVGKLSSMYMYAWKKGIKTTYYLRSRPATEIAHSTINMEEAKQGVVCSLENPGACEACQ